MASVVDDSGKGIHETDSDPVKAQKAVNHRIVLAYYGEWDKGCDFDS